MIKKCSSVVVFLCSVIAVICTGVSYAHNINIKKISSISKSDDGITVTEWPGENLVEGDIKELTGHANIDLPQDRFYVAFPVPKTDKIYKIESFTMFDYNGGEHVVYPSERDEGCSILHSTDMYDCAVEVLFPQRKEGIVYKSFRLDLKDEQGNLLKNPVEAYMFDFDVSLTSSNQDGVYNTLELKNNTNKKIDTIDVAEGKFLDFAVIKSKDGFKIKLFPKACTSTKDKLREVINVKYKISGEEDEAILVVEVLGSCDNSKQLLLAAKEEALKKAKEDADKAQEEALKKAKEDADKAKEEALKKAKEDADKAQEETLKKAKEDADKAQAEALKKAKEDADKAKEEALKKAKEDADKSQEETLKKAKEDADKAKEEALKKAKEDADKAQEEALKKAKEDADKAQEEALKKAKEDADKAQEEALKKAKEEILKKAKEDADKAQEEALKKAKEDADKAKEEALKKAKEDADKAKEEALKKAKEDADKAKEEVLKKAKEDADKAKEEALKKAKEDADKAQEEALKKAKEDADIAQKDAFDKGKEEGLRGRKAAGRRGAERTKGKIERQQQDD